MANYAMGAVIENRCKDQLEAEGWFAFRSAGSHGAADVIAIHPNGLVRFIQCKKTRHYLPSVEKANAKALAEANLPGGTMIQRQLWTWINNKGWKVLDI